MSELLSQKEIDELLNASISSPDEEELEEKINEASKKNYKTYKWKIDKHLRFVFPRQSSVIKDYNFNPDPEEIVETNNNRWKFNQLNNEIIVRSIKNYNEYRNNQRGC